MGLSPILRNILIGVPIGITFIDTVGYVAKVEGVSMQPALNPDDKQADYVFLNRWAVRSYELQHGDVVIFVSPKHPSQKLIKRIVGLSGDIVTTIGYKTPLVELWTGIFGSCDGESNVHRLATQSVAISQIDSAEKSDTLIETSDWGSIANMRAVKFVKRLEWEVSGTIFRHGLTIGDVDNDGDNELIAGTAEGDVYIFKGSEVWQKITGLGLISCVAVGDIFNYGCNALVVICGDGWAHIFYSPRSVNLLSAPINILRSQTPNDDPTCGKMECVHLQRIPTNAKVVLVADIDKDGANEMVIGLTDRVVRSYRWSTNTELGTGKLVGLNKWECANQIGTVTLQHTRDGSPTLLVGQPGGTFMRIKCNNLEKDDDNENDSCVDYQTLGISRMRNPNISTEIIGDLEPGAGSISTWVDNKQKFVPKTEFRRNYSQPDIRQTPTMPSGNKSDDDNHPRFYSRVNSPEINVDNVYAGNVDTLMDRGRKGKPYALATLDGTIMLVKDEIILWAMQVDHQIFALCRLNMDGGEDKIVACTWDGQTYILDQQRRSVRFQFEEPVRAFTTGQYSVKSGTSTPCLVYHTFNNKLFLYHDVVLPSMVISPLNHRILDQSAIFEQDSNPDDMPKSEKLRNLTEYLLYGL